MCSPLDCLVALPALLAPALPPQETEQESWIACVFPTVPPSADAARATNALRLLRDRERPSDDEIAATVADAAASELGLLYDVLSRRMVPGYFEAPPQVLSILQERVILQALERMDHRVVVAHALAAVAADDSERSRIAAVQFLGAAGGRAAVATVFDLALPEGEAALADPMKPALRRALAAIIARDPEALEELGAATRRLPHDLLRQMVLAIGDAGDPGGLELLSELLLWKEELALEVMAQVRCLGRSSDEGVNEELEARLRSHLDPKRPTYCRAAMLAVATMRDCDSVADLIGILDSSSPGLRDTAHWALCEITELSLSPSPETWSSWLERELTWAAREKAKAFRRLRSQEPEEVESGIREISNHPMAREQLEVELATLLHHKRASVRALACRTLAQLGGKRAVADLIVVLEDRAAEVRLAALEALRAITKLDLPPTVEAWQDAT